MNERLSIGHAVSVSVATVSLHARCSRTLQKLTINEIFCIDTAREILASLLVITISLQLYARLECIPTFIDIFTWQNNYICDKEKLNFVEGNPTELIKPRISTALSIMPSVGRRRIK